MLCLSAGFGPQISLLNGHACIVDPPEDGDSTLFIADGGRGAVVALPSATASRHDVVWASCFFFATSKCK